MEVNLLKEQGTLYIVGTPIGNLSDMTPRAVETLEQVDFIAAEDTRVTLGLLNHFGIKKPMVSYFEHNIREKGDYIAGRLAAGESCAIVTDAGMPCISDPGADLVRICGERGIPTVVVPGPSAVVSAVALSGFPAARFTFEGFLSVNRNTRSAHLDSLKAAKDAKRDSTVTAADERTEVPATATGRKGGRKGKAADIKAVKAKSGKDKAVMKEDEE